MSWKILPDDCRGGHSWPLNRSLLQQAQAIQQKLTQRRKLIFKDFGSPLRGFKTGSYPAASSPSKSSFNYFLSTKSLSSNPLHDTRMLPSSDG